MRTCPESSSAILTPTGFAEKEPFNDDASLYLAMYHKTEWHPFPRFYPSSGFVLRAGLGMSLVLLNNFQALAFWLWRGNLGLHGFALGSVSMHANSYRIGKGLLSQPPPESGATARWQRSAATGLVIEPL